MSNWYVNTSKPWEVRNVELHANEQYPKELEISFVFEMWVRGCYKKADQHVNLFENWTVHIVTVGKCLDYCWDSHPVAVS